MGGTISSLISSLKSDQGTETELLGSSGSPCSVCEIDVIGKNVKSDRAKIVMVRKIVILLMLTSRSVSVLGFKIRQLFFKIVLVFYEFSDSLDVPAFGAK